MLGAVSAFLKDTVSEDIKKLVQPLSLSTAAVFIFLNLFLVLPPLVERNNTVIAAFLSLDDGWQVLTVTLLTLVLSYLLLNFGTSILKLLTGELWSDSVWLGSSLKQIHTRARTRLNIQYESATALAKAQEERRLLLQDDVKRYRLKARREWPDVIRKDSEDNNLELHTRQAHLADLEEQYDKAAAVDAESPLDLWRKITTFPEEEGFVAPTALGNVLNATASYVWRHYRIDFSAMWSHMETVVADQEKLKARIDNEKSALDFLTTLTFVLLVFGIEYLFFATYLLRQWNSVLLSIGLILLSYVVYRAAIGKARAWGDVVQMAFDLHRDDLRKKLGIREFRSWADEQDVWLRVSRWLLWGGIGRTNEVPHEVFKVQGESLPLPVTVTAPAKVQYKLEYGVTSMAPPSAALREPEKGPARQIAKYRRRVEYVLMLESGDANIDNVQIVVNDPQVPYIGAAPVVTSWDTQTADPTHPVAAGADPSSQVGPLPTAQVLRTLAGFTPGSGGVPANKVLWKIGKLCANKVYILRYQLPVPVFLATTNSESLIITHDEAEGGKGSDFQYVHSFRIENVGDKEVDALLDVFDLGTTRSAQLTQGTLKASNGGGKPIDATITERLNRSRWELGKIAPGNGWVTLTYSVKKW